MRHSLFFLFAWTLIVLPLPESSVFAQAKSQPLVVESPPVLSCPTENSIAVVWAVRRLAAGVVEYGTDKDNLDQIAMGEFLGLNMHHERYIQIRLRGLKPNTRYYYRTVTTPIIFHNASNIERQESETSDVFSFETTGSGGDTGTFSFICDTHRVRTAWNLLTPKLTEIGSDYTVVGGDIAYSFDTAEIVVNAILRPGDEPYATERPMLFIPGNHDHKGQWARNLWQAIPIWEHDAPEDRLMARNFVVRKGPLALIGLDTGADRPDAHVQWNGLISFEPYRIAQRDWLERTLKSPVVATAPFVVAFCHMPLFDSYPRASGGDLAETSSPVFQRQAGNLWGPLLTEYGVQLLVVGHRHKFRYDAPTTERTWTQIVGGGHEPKGQVTIIHGKASGDTLEVIVDELNNGEELGRWTFPKRNIK